MTFRRFGVCFLGFLALMVAVRSLTLWKHRLEAWLLQRARIDWVDRDARALHHVAREYRSEKGAWPRTMEEILEYVVASGTEGCNLIPRDPWRQDYSLGVEHGKLVITSFGKDRRPGGIGEDADFLSVAGQRVFVAASRER